VALPCARRNDGEGEQRARRGFGTEVLLNEAYLSQLPRVQVARAAVLVLVPPPPA
jgi:hypothetical protein